MASAYTPIGFCIGCSTKHHHLPLTRNSSNLVLPLLRSSSSSSSLIAFSRRRNNSPITSKHKNEKTSPRKDTVEDDDIDEDAFEALFKLLEEDLNNDDLSLNDDDDISEEDLAKLELELEEALKDDELLGEMESIIESKDGDVVIAEDDNEDEDEDAEMPVKLKSWQLKRLAYALRKGRRKTNIKNLAADLCLDRAVVLELLRDPPPNLVMLSATLPDEPVPRMLEPESRPHETLPVEISDVKKPDAKMEVPVHVMQSSWSSQKRLKKVQLETLEQVYQRSKRPTNAMISSIVHVTNLPRKRVLKWFEDKRSEEGVPDRRLPYQPSSQM